MLELPFPHTTTPLLLQQMRYDIKGYTSLGCTVALNPYIQKEFHVLYAQSNCSSKAMPAWPLPNNMSATTAA
jgi:hypothetical protein